MKETVREPGCEMYALFQDLEQPDTVVLPSDRSRCIVGSNIFADGRMSSQLLSRAPFGFRNIGDR